MVAAAWLGSRGGITPAVGLNKWFGKFARRGVMVALGLIRSQEIGFPERFNAVDLLAAPSIGDNRRRDSATL